MGVRKSFKKIFYFVPFSVFLLIAVLVLAQKVTTPKSQEVLSSQVQEKKVSISIISGSKEDSYEYELSSPKNAFEALKETAEREKIALEYESYDFGEMVTSIDNQKADKKNYWAFYVNGNLSQVGANQYMLRDGDSIEWKLENFN